MFIRVQDGRVVELFSALPVLHPDIMQHIFEVDQAQEGWDFNGVTASPPPTPPRDIVADCAAVDALRDLKITSGFTFANKRFQTRSDDVKRIAGAGSSAGISLA